jgi:hypothetical protein
MNHRVDRVLFQHDGMRDFTVVASSLPHSEWNRYEHWLRYYVRGGGHSRPAACIRYVTQARTAAILRQVRGKGNNRSDSCQVLVGPSTTLTHRTALAMRQWSGWDDQYWSSRLVGVRVDDIKSALHRPWERQSPREINSFDLAAAVVALLRKSDRPLSLITNPNDQDWVADFLWVLFDLIEELFREEHPDFAWTFSTFESSDHSGSSKPVRIAVLPPTADIDRNYGTVRSQVHLSAQAVDNNGDPKTYIAAALVNRYLQHGRQKLHYWMAHNGVFVQRSVAARIQRLEEVIENEKPLTDVQLFCRLWNDNLDPIPVLAEIRRRSESSPQDRAEVRRILLTYPEWLDRVCAAVPPEQADESVSAVMQFAIPVADLTSEDAMGNIAWVLRQCSDAPLCRALNRHLIVHGAHGIILDAAMYQYSRQAGLTVPESVIRPVPAWAPPVASDHTTDPSLQDGDHKPPPSSQTISAHVADQGGTSGASADEAVTSTSQPQSGSVAPLGAAGQAPTGRRQQLADLRNDMPPIVIIATVAIVLVILLLLLITVKSCGSTGNTKQSDQITIGSSATTTRMPAELVGSWVRHNRDTRLTYQFQSDGKYRSLEASTQLSHTVDGVVDVVGTTITLHPISSSDLSALSTNLQYKWRIENSMLILVSDNQMELTFERQSL